MELKCLWLQRGIQMVLNTVGQYGLTAVNRGLNRIDQAAEQIAKASMGAKVEGKPLDLIKPIVELKAADLETQAAIKLLEVEKDTVGSLLNVKA